MNQKTSQTKTLMAQSEGVAVISMGEDKSGFANLAASLAEIRKLKGVRGYILRNGTSAIIDLMENDKVIHYALLASQINESSGEMAKQFNLTDIESVIVEGKEIKILCMRSGENKVDVFMEKAASHAWIMKRILL